LTEEERRRYGISFEIEGTTKTWVGDCNTYGWHRSFSLHAAAVESALMALERWLYTEVDGGRNISRWLQTILARAESLAFAASRKPEWRKVLAVRKEKPESLELLLAKLDPDSYTNTPEPDGMVRIEMRVPAHLESTIKQVQEEGGLKMLAIALASRARQYLSSGNPLPANDVPAFAAELERLAEWKPPAGDEPLVQYRLNSLADAVAVL
jgi:hypothetical protein